VAGGLNLYQFNGNDPVSYSDPFGLCVPMPLCLLAGAGAGGGTVAVGGAASTVSVGAVATVAIPAAIVVGVAVWANLPVHPVPTHQVPGALVQSDATAVAVPHASEMASAKDWIKRLIVAGGIYIGGGVPERAKHSDQDPATEQPAKPTEEKAERRPEESEP
jgi:hypothetical protein